MPRDADGQGTVPQADPKMILGVAAAQHCRGAVKHRKQAASPPLKLRRNCSKALLKAAIFRSHRLFIVIAVSGMVRGSGLLLGGLSGR